MRRVAVAQRTLPQAGYQRQVANRSHQRGFTGLISTIFDSGAWPVSLLRFRIEHDELDLAIGQAASSDSAAAGSGSDCVAAIDRSYTPSASGTLIVIAVDGALGSRVVLLGPDALAGRDCS